MSRKWTLRGLAGTLAAGTCLVAAPGAAAAPPPPPMDGAPEEAEVRFQSHFGLPPAAYSLICVEGLNGCSTSGTIELATHAEVPVARTGSGATKGVGSLGYSRADGSVSMTYGCEGEEPWHSQIEPVGSSAGELEVASVAALPGTNALSVALNHAGMSGGDFPQETIDRSDGGCGTPVQDLTQQMGTWYATFQMAHQAEQQPTSNDLELQGLTFENGAFTKTYERFVNVGTGLAAHQVYENTRIEVEPEWCHGAQNRITSAVAGGQSMGLDGSSFYAGQVITAPADAKLRLGDGSVIELDKGDKYRIQGCEESMTQVYLGDSVGKFWANVKKALGGSKKKFEVQTERAVAGVRGTVFQISYNEKKQLTRLAVKEGSVSLKGINGAKGKIMVKAGQVGVQKGKKAPKLVKR